MHRRSIRGEIVRASRLMHGKHRPLRITGTALFSDLTTSFEAGRYHSLVVKRTSLPGCLEITAESDDGEIMALCHREFPVVRSAVPSRVRAYP